MRGGLGSRASLVAPFLEWSDRRDLRERAFELWTRRGELDPAHDNRPVAREILKLRHELAHLHGHRAYADYALVDRMAKTPAAVARLLERVWEPAKAKAVVERDALQEMALASGATHAIEPWDWRYYAEKVRRARYQIDDAEVKPYFALDRMLEAAFDCAGRLFGIRFVPLATSPPTTRTCACSTAGRSGASVGVFCPDNFMRPTKRAARGCRLWPARTLGQQPTSSTTTTSPRRPRASRHCCRPTTCARCSTSSATGCMGFCRRSTTNGCRARACCATSSSCRRNCSSIGRSIRRSCASTRDTR
jgi:Zn-dependent oligopeptidase